MSIVRDNSGKWLDTSVFRKAGEFFMKHSYYCADPYGSPAWYEFWKEERRRCLKGYEVAGHKITGNYYFYLNYCPIQKVDILNATGRRANKIKGFPDFWDGDYNYFWIRDIARDGILEALHVSKEEQARINALPDEERFPILREYYDTLGLFFDPLPDQLDGGLDLILGKARRRGFSFKNASVAVCNFFHRPNSYTMLIAYEKKYLFPGKKTIFGKCKEYINFVNEHTAWKMPSDYINTQQHIRASYKETKDGVDIEKGFMSEIEAISFKDNPDAGRGADAYDIIGEEVGAWGTPGGLKNTIAAMRSSSEAGIFKTGMMTMFGCVCKGTKVWTNSGTLTTIEDVSKDTGILGYASKGTMKENISWLQPPGQKECVRITTDKGYVIECSKDHPLLWSKKTYRDKNKNKFATFKRAEDIKVGEHLLQVRQVPQFGSKQMWNPRLVGLLIGDGYYGTKYSSAQLCISQKELLDYIDMLGIEYSICEGKSCEEPFFRYITLQGTQKEMRLLGLQGQSKSYKRLPDNIWQYNKYSVAELIGGLFDSDGNVQGHGVKKRISLCSVVPELLDEVRTQLFKLGIQANIYKRNHQDTILKSRVNNKESFIQGKHSYTLEICDLESIRNFKKHIHFIVESKRDRLNSWNLEQTSSEKTIRYKYKHTIEKGDYFISNSDMEYLVGRRVEKIEDIGLQDIYNLSTELTHTYITNGFISHNTSGDMEGGTVDFADLFRRPKANGFMSFKDRWGKFKEKVEGFFFPKHMNTEGFYDENGNSDMEAAKQAELLTRKTLIDNGATSTEIQKRMQEEPLDSAEAFALVAANTFPVVELQAQLDKVIAMNLQAIKGTPVKLHYVDGKITATPILDGSAKPITSFKDIPLDIQGCPIIYEFPADPPAGLYKIGYDPIRQEHGTSLAGIIVYKGTQVGSYTHDIPVAEYVGRYDDPDDIDRVAEMFADLFNTKVMYENEVTGVKNYFRRIKRLSLLALQPDTVISKNIKKSKVARVYGCHMNEQLKDAGERYVKSWLLTVLDYDENDNPVRVIDRIYSIRLLEELISYFRKGNFDLVSALFMCMFQVQEEVLGKEYGEEEDTPKSKKYRQLMEMMQTNFK